MNALIRNQVRGKWKEMRNPSVIGILIPEGCKNIYVFQKREDFISQIESGKMIALYGNEENQENMNLFVAYVP